MGFVGIESMRTEYPLFYWEKCQSRLKGTDFGGLGSNKRRFLSVVTFCGVLSEYLRPSSCMLHNQ